jgi:ribosomal-protein-alanine N-acetyltransferase
MGDKTVGPGVRAGVDTLREDNHRNADRTDNADNTIEAPVTLRAMMQSDVPEVMRIENASYQLPWTEQIFLDCLKVGYHTLVADSGGALGGFVIFSSAAGESHILNLCVDPRCRRQGYAEGMLAQAMATVIVAGAGTMFLEVRISNTAAIRLYEKMGFAEAGRRPNYYKTRGKTPNSVGDVREDALLMARDLTSIG